MALPVQPCRGVEDANKVTGCGGEGIWDYAWGYASNQTSFGLAVNPTSRRSRHQLHIHVAKVQQNLQAALAQVAKNKDKQYVAINCNSNKVTDSCKYNSNPAQTQLQAKWVDAASPSKANPFSTVYGNPANQASDSALVSMPLGPKGGVVILRSNDRQAECFLFCQDVCQNYCT